MSETSLGYKDVFHKLEGDIEMEVIDAIRNRRSIRGFKPKPVSREILEEILNISLWAPSSRNQQSWEFAVLGGSAMDKVKTNFGK